MKKLKLIRIDLDINEQIMRAAALESRTVSNMVREIVRRYLDGSMKNIQSHAEKGLSNRQRAWLEIMTEFENKNDIDILRDLVFDVIRKAHVDVDGIWKRYR